MQKIILSQKINCNGCRAWLWDFGGQGNCKLGYEVNGLYPKEPCPKPKNKMDYTLNYLRLKKNEPR